MYVCVCLGGREGGGGVKHLKERISSSRSKFFLLSRKSVYMCVCVGGGGGGGFNT